jgi:DNA-binding transcriptional LysR family regulator
MFDLNDVALFVQVVRSGSFAEAARQLGMPSNTLSRRVQQLEGQLGTRLLQRSTRKLTLTDAGEQFHEQCSGAVEGLLEAGQQLITGSQEPSGTVRVAAMADFFDFFPMEWVAGFLAKHPHVRLDFVLSDARADLIAERIDIAFRGGALQDSGYVGRQLLSAGHDGLVASPDYLNRRGVPGTLQDLETHDCVSFAHPSGITTWRLTGADGGEEAVQITSRFNGNTAQALRKATLAGLGIALLPSAITHIDLQAGRLVPVLADYYRTGYGLHLLYPSRKHLPLAVSAFIELVMEKLKEQTFPANV